MSQTQPEFCGQQAWAEVRRARLRDPHPLQLGKPRLLGLISRGFRRDFWRKGFTRGPQSPLLWAHSWALPGVLISTKPLGPCQPTVVPGHPSDMERLPVTWAAGLPLPRLWHQGPHGTGQNPRVLSQPPIPAGICRYKDYREPPWSEHKYDISKDFWAVLAARLAFVIVFQVRRVQELENLCQAGSGRGVPTEASGKVPSFCALFSFDELL